MLAAEGDHVAALAARVLTAGQAPRSAPHAVAPAADPESGRAGQAVDAQREGVRQAGRSGPDARPGRRRAERAGGELVRRHPVVVAVGTGQRDVSYGAVGAGQGEAFGDLGGRVASGAGNGAHGDATVTGAGRPGAPRPEVPWPAAIAATASTAQSTSPGV